MVGFERSLIDDEHFVADQQDLSKCLPVVVTGLEVLLGDLTFLGSRQASEELAVQKFDSLFIVVA